MILSSPMGELASLGASRRCVAAVEFALLAPIFVLCFAGVVDLGNALWTWCRLEQAIAAGANFALVNATKVSSTNGQGLANDIANIVANSNIVGSYTTPANVTVVVNDGPTTTITGGSSSTSGTAANADSYYCPTGSPPNWNWNTAYAAAGSSCTSGGMSGQFVTITASYNFTPFFASYSFVASGAMTAGSVVQTQ